jgi:glycosyltransferase involved in cell wall biosynthesis
MTYYWPPSGGSGVQRWMYFAKYLKQQGWIPFVITVDEKNASYPVLDQSLLTEVDNIHVIKTKTVEPLKWYSLLFTGSKKGGIPQGEVQKSGLLRKLAAYIRGNFFIPDARKGWNSYAVREAVKLVKKENIKTVITTGPPHSTHLIGLRLKSLSEIKWFADFRDPWTAIFYNKYLYRSTWAEKIDNRLEEKVLLTADGILTTTGGRLVQKLRTKSTEQSFHVLPNGYDASLMASITRTNVDPFHIVYTGLLTENQDFPVVTKALAVLSKTNKIRFSIAGQISEPILNYIKGKLPKVQVEHKGYISHEQSLKLMKSGDLLLNFIFKTAEEDMISGKLFEYLATEIPVLSIGNPNSEAGNLLSQASFSEMIPSNDKIAIQNFIVKAITQKGKAVSKLQGIEKWSRLEITKDLIELILREQQ